MTEPIKVHDKIRILPTLRDELVKLGFAPKEAQGFHDRFARTTQEAHAIWTDEDSGVTFVTVDLCCEVPIQCCEPV